MGECGRESRAIYHRDQKANSSSSANCGEYVGQDGREGVAKSNGGCQQAILFNVLETPEQWQTIPFTLVPYHTLIITLQ